MIETMPDDPKAESDQSAGREYVQSLERGLAVIRAFGPDRAEMTLSEVAAATGLTRAAARRFLLTLQTLGHVRNDGRRFRLTPHVLTLGYAYLSALPWWQNAHPHMEEVVAALGESCSAAVLDGDDIVYVARVPARRIMTINLAIGTTLPAHVTSLGRVLLAEQEPAWLDRYLGRVELVARTPRTVTDPGQLRDIVMRARADGYALVDEELELGLRSLAVVLRDRAGRPLAALNVSASATRTTADAMVETYLPVLCEAARRITLTLPG